MARLAVARPLASATGCARKAPRICSALPRPGARPRRRLDRQRLSKSGSRAPPTPRWRGADSPSPWCTPGPRRACSPAPISRFSLRASSRRRLAHQVLRRPILHVEHRQRAVDLGRRPVRPSVHGDDLRVPARVRPCAARPRPRPRGCQPPAQLSGFTTRLPCGRWAPTLRCTSKICWREMLRRARALERSAVVTRPCPDQPVVSRVSGHAANAGARRCGPAAWTAPRAPEPPRRTIRARTPCLARAVVRSRAIRSRA